MTKFVRSIGNLCATLILAASTIPVLAAAGEQGSGAPARLDQRAQAAIERAEEALEDQILELVSRLAAGEAGRTDALVACLREAASDLRKATIRFEAKDHRGALKDAAEALEGLEQAAQLRGRRQR
jgi:hypothetical protein